LSYWFILSVWLSVWGWNTVNNFISISSILFNFFVSSTVNCSSLSDTILSGNPSSFYTLSLSSLTNPSTDIPSVVTTKYVIFDNLLQTTRIASFLATNSNLVMKSTIRWVHSFSSTSLNFNFPVGISVQFFILWHISHLFTYFPISLVTSGYQ